MTNLTLSKTETAFLVDAAGRGGALHFPDSTKPATQQRHLGRFLRDNLIVASGEGHALTPAGYRAVGLRPPRRFAAIVDAEASPKSARAPGSARPGRKLALIRELLGRGEGATLEELIKATGWLPHTTRAALSRIRSAGQDLAKSSRPDGKVAYRIDTGLAVGPDQASSSEAPPKRQRRKTVDTDASVGNVA